MYTCRYVRQGVLYCLAMLVSATLPHTLASLTEGGGLMEAIQWARDLVNEDSDLQCRTLASHVLALFQIKLKEVSCCCTNIFPVLDICFFIQATAGSSEL